MRSFAVIAGFAASANAYAYGYNAYNTTSSAAPAYPAVSSAPAYAVSSEAPVYMTSTIKGLTTVCPEPTTLHVGTKTYVIKTSTTLVDEDCEYTTVVPVKPTHVPGKPTSEVHVPGKPTATVSASVHVPGVSSAVHVPYPSANGTHVAPPAGTAAPSASGTKPVSPEFTGAASQIKAGAFLAIAGAVAAFL